MAKRKERLALSSLHTLCSYICSQRNDVRTSLNAKTSSLTSNVLMSSSSSSFAGDKSLFGRQHLCDISTDKSFLHASPGMKSRLFQII